MNAQLENIAVERTPRQECTIRVTGAHVSPKCAPFMGSVVPAVPGQVKPHHLRFWQLAFELGTETFASADLHIPGAERVAV